MNLMSEKVTIRIPKELLSAAKRSAITIDCKLSAFIRTCLIYSIEALEEDKSNKLK